MEVGGEVKKRGERRREEEGEGIPKNMNYKATDQLFNLHAAVLLCSL